MESPFASENGLIDELDLQLQVEFQEGATAWANRFAEEEASRPNQLLPKTMLFERFLMELQDDFAKRRKQQENGAFTIVESLRELAQEHPEFFTQEVGEGIAKIGMLSEIVVQNKEEFSGHLSEGGTLQEFAHVDDATMNVFFQAAKRLEKQQRFNDAADAFGFLTGLNPQRYMFWLALGNAEYLSKRYEEALGAYVRACMANPRDPMCHIASSRCYVAIGEILNAINALELALFVMDERPEYGDWRTRVEKEKKRLEQLQHH